MPPWMLRVRTRKTKLFMGSRKAPAQRSVPKWSSVWKQIRNIWLRSTRSMPTSPQTFPAGSRVCANGAPLEMLNLQSLTMLQINNLHAEIDGKEILKGLSLEVTAGEVSFEGQDLLEMAPYERAAAGLFLGFQYPVEIPGVSNVQFLREALNAQRKGRGEAPLSGADFLKIA